jgi:hypothetical protein
MAFLNPVSIFKSKSSRGAGVSERRSLPSDMAQQVARQCSDWGVQRLASCTFARRSDSSFPDCKAEVEIFDANGKLVVRGREFRSGAPLFWQA